VNAERAIGLLAVIAIVVVVRRRLRDQGAVEVRPGVLLLSLAAAVAIGFTAGSLGIDRHYALAIAIGLVILGIGLSLRPVHAPESQQIAEP
jgi:hypothetical protein